MEYKHILFKWENILIHRLSSKLNGSYSDFVVLPLSN